MSQQHLDGDGPVEDFVAAFQTSAIPPLAKSRQAGNARQELAVDRRKTWHCHQGYRLGRLLGPSTPSARDLGGHEGPSLQRRSLTHATPIVPGPACVPMTGPISPTPPAWWTVRHPPF